MADNIEPNTNIAHTRAEVGGLRPTISRATTRSQLAIAVSAGLVLISRTRYKCQQPAGDARARVTRWDFRRPKIIRIIAERAADANFNALFFQVRGNADAPVPFADRAMVGAVERRHTGRGSRLGTRWNPPSMRRMPVSELMPGSTSTRPGWVRPPPSYPEQMYNSFNSPTTRNG